MKKKFHVIEYHPINGLGIMFVAHYKGGIAFTAIAEAAVRYLEAKHAENYLKQLQLTTSGIPSDILERLAVNEREFDEQTKLRMLPSTTGVINKLTT